MSYFSPVQAYQSTGTVARISEANPHQLVQQLFDGVVQRLRFAKTCIQRKDMLGKAQAMGKITAIINELQKTLNLEQGGELAERLEALYEYAMHRVFEANVRNDASGLDEVERLFSDLGQTWLQIKPN